jgi:putative membrane protein
MLAEHTAAHNDLKTMGGVVGFTVKDTIDAARATTIAQLNTLTGRDFDSTYIHNQLLDHQAAINFYTDELNNGNQLNVKAYANTILQNIRLHYQRADSIATAFSY